MKHSFILGITVMVAVSISLWYFSSYVHYQTATAVDCSLLTIQGYINYKQGMTDDSLTDMIGFDGKNMTIKQTRQLCFDSATIHYYEACYYLPCGTDVNQTVNYQDKPIRKALDDPEKIHLFPNGNQMT
jgi:hypothetical protein